MHTDTDLRTLSVSPALLVGAGALNIVAALALVKVSPAAGLAIGLIPLLGILAALALTEGGRIFLLGVALSLQLFFPPANKALPLGSANIHPQDLLIVVALGAWAFGTLIARREGSVSLIPRTPVLGWPFVVLAGTILIATLRGHYAFGTSIVGQPLRFVLYAAIVVTLAGMTPPLLYRLLLWLFYTGACVTMVWATYYIATGTSGTTQDHLSTGGTRILEISTTVYCGGTLFLALLSLKLESQAKHRMLHLAMAVVGLTGIVLGFGRAVFGAVFVVCTLLLLTSRSLRRSLGSVLPLAVPFLVLFAIMVPRVAPDTVSAFQNRISASPTRDANVEWRVQANKAVLAQVREAPYVGSGFGRETEFFIQVKDSAGFLVPFRLQIFQDPHNGYLWLWAGGGIIALGAFLAVLATFVVDAVRRFRGTNDEIERLIVLWAMATVFPALFDAASGTTFENPGDLMFVWVLLVIPAVVPLRPRQSIAGGAQAPRRSARSYRAA
jgi:O-antigen ligase